MVVTTLSPSVVKVELAKIDSEDVSRDRKRENLSDWKKNLKFALCPEGERLVKQLRSRWNNQPKRKRYW